MKRASFLSFVISILLTVACSSKNETFSYLALGDSYTIGTAIGEKNSYASKLAKTIQDSLSTANVSLQIIAKNGWTTKDLLNGIEAENPSGPFDLVTILIGVNNQYQHVSKTEYRIEFLALLEKSIALAVKKNVLVLSIPDYGVCPAAVSEKESIAQDIDMFNQINKQLSDSLEVAYLDITEISRTAFNNLGLVALDQLHFSEEMHKLWVEEILRKIKKARML